MHNFIVTRASNDIEYVPPASRTSDDLVISTVAVLATIQMQITSSNANPLWARLRVASIATAASGACFRHDKVGG
jgi:hypothetical protein